MEEVINRTGTFPQLFPSTKNSFFCEDVIIPYWQFQAYDTINRLENLQRQNTAIIQRLSGVENLVAGTGPGHQLLNNKKLPHKSGQQSLPSTVGPFCKYSGGSELLWFRQAIQGHTNKVSRKEPRTIVTAAVTVQLNLAVTSFVILY